MNASHIRPRTRATRTGATARLRAGGTLPRRADATRRRARLLAALILAVLLAVLVPILAACGGDDEPFAGLWWEPATGRRIEIRLENGQYWLYYGAAKRPHLAERDGDELRIRDPLGAPVG